MEFGEARNIVPRIRTAQQSVPAKVVEVECHGEACIIIRTSWQVHLDGHERRESAWLSTGLLSRLGLELGRLLLDALPRALHMLPGGVGLPHTKAKHELIPQAGVG